MRLLVGPLEAAPALCEAHGPSHLVSWLSPPATAPEIAALFPPERRLFLSSHDLAAPTEGLQAPTADDVARLFAFARRWAETGVRTEDGARPMLVHCWAGVSRSTAAAFAIACALTSKPEVELAWALRAASPGATPNPLIVAHADALLGRDGRMVAAIAEIGRGAEVSLGAPFELQLG
ncbi:hypothetical protein LJR225_000677 [Phenylobacterium sp. LjRoot225]|uniref:tyrosine phosphatase family protein n=1 Tax=Phenylobacterium sp. LjRoot225 TaxID=3342285 RepID=UPI003ECE7A9C